MADVTLSKNDSTVLSALFDPESSLSNSIHIVHGSPDRTSSTAATEQVKARERNALQVINQEQPNPTDIESCVSELTAIIQDHPYHASAWNNRAQARRMLINDQDLHRHPRLVAQIFHDLGRAIELSAPTTLSTDSISDADARVLASAYSHRGYLLLVASKSAENSQMLSEVPSLRRLSPSQLEEAASRDLGLGGRYGNETARQLAVKTNPYAKLCGSIVREALTKEISDYYRPQVSMTNMTS